MRPTVVFVFAVTVVPDCFGRPKVAFSRCCDRMTVTELSGPALTYSRDQLFALYTPDRPAQSVVVRLQLLKELGSSTDS